MGANLSFQYFNKHGCKIGNVFYPMKRYKLFPRHQPTSPGSLVVQFEAYPKQFFLQPVDTTDVYWWVDAQFLPYDDSKIMVTSSVFRLDSSRCSTTPITGITNGKIFVVDINSITPAYRKIKSTMCSTRPKLSFHPSGCAVGYLGKGELNLINLNGEVVYNRQKDITNAAFNSCALSPNGEYLVFITKYSNKFTLHISELKMSNLIKNNLPCYKICRNFEGKVANLMWSPDSQYIAIGNDNGGLFVVDFRTLTKACNIFTDVDISGALSSITSFDFNPHYAHSILAVGSFDLHTAEVKLYFVNFVFCEILKCLEVTKEEDKIDCIKYNSNGDAIAVALHSCKVIIFDLKEDTKLLTIEVDSLDSSLLDRHILSMMFSFNGEKLLCCCCDGGVRIYNSASQVKTLQSLCRYKILSQTNVSSVLNLPLPVSIHKYLLNQPIHLQ